MPEEIEDPETGIGKINLEDINIDEIPTDETELEEVDETGDESDLIEDIFHPSQPEIHFQGEQTKPFLEQEPIENLEQELQNIPGTQAQQTGADEQGVFNAPQYSSSSAGNYTDKDYYEQPGDETYPERFTSAINPPTPRDFITPASRTRFEETFEQVPRRLIQREDTMAWRTNEQLQDWDMDKEKYKTSLETRKRRDDLL